MRRTHLCRIGTLTLLLVGCGDGGQPEPQSTDTAQVDTGTPDVGIADVGTTDAGGPDVLVADAAPQDAATMDAATMDAATMDAAAFDASPVDSATGTLPQTGKKVWVRYTHGGKTRFGRVVGTTIYELDGNFLGPAKPTGKTVPMAQATLLAPVVPGKVLAIGLNYADHGSSPSSAPPPAFFKQPGCVVGPGEPILRPKGANNLHFEGELVLVIGKEASDVPEAKALDVVFGVTAGNDVSERTWQSSDLQWFRAKGADTFGPIGPTVVSGVDYQKLAIKTAVNGKTVQDSAAFKMIHPIAKIVSFVSSVMTLHPGDIIFTGTPGKTFALSNGDVVSVTVEGVGTLSNAVKAK